MTVWDNIRVVHSLYIIVMTIWNINGDTFMYITVLIAWDTSINFFLHVKDAYAFMVGLKDCGE